ncbi:hypothetical protein AB0D49_13655 [Streptomyces sp. NPDC048290]|uniref:hypothetical protein n=1 Tax=Streptomyces sp. NPDC048290 TaxID=3155811 RepID=UPI0034348A34
MSRETDSPSSGPTGHGGTAYPSGTPPYGTPAATDGGADAGRSAAQPEERKTETTLTTRVRINIPGSRPIPPVVVRTPVADGEGDGDRTAAEPPPTPGPPDATASGAPGAPGVPAAPGAPAGDKTSDWFAPRKPGQPAPGPRTGSTANGGAPATGSGTTPPTGTPTAAAAPGTRPASAPRPGAARPGTGTGLPGGATGGPVAPGHGGGTGSFDVTEALTAGQRPGNGSRRDEGPYAPENGYPQGDYAHPQTPAVPGVPGVPGAPGGSGGQNGQGGPHGYGGPQGPAGPTGGPVTGDGHLAPPPPHGTTAMAAHGVSMAPGGGLSDDTAILTPQVQVPEPPGGIYAPPENVSGDTLTSGIPVVPATDRTTPAPAPGGNRPDGPQSPPRRTEPAPQQSAPAAAPRKKKGRSKLVLLVGGVVVIAGVAYGAGLLMNHSDVPKGTTVLGVDIGGGTRDDAVKKLDAALGKRTAAPLKLTVDGETVSLPPDQAGLQFDADATVAAAAGSDYNPVSVIGSLFGEKRIVEPVMPVDEEKLLSALADAAGGATGAGDGTIRFESGKAVAVYGKTGKGVDTDQAADAVEQAYRTQVETGTATPLPLPTTTVQPTVTDAEVDRMMKEFAEPAMSDLITVRTDAGHSIDFSPENSLWKFLQVKAVDGKLVDSYDEAALQELYGSTFDGVLITRGTGEKTPVTVQDVISALRPALKSPDNRVATIETNPS